MLQHQNVKAEKWPENDLNWIIIPLAKKQETSEAKREKFFFLFFVMFMVDRGRIIF